MSGRDSSCPSRHRISVNSPLWETGEGSKDEGRRLKKREKNRVAAQRSRKRQTQRADLLHETCELLEQRNQKLRREVDSLSQEQRLLTEALRAHESFCPIMHCGLTSWQPAQRDASGHSDLFFKADHCVVQHQTSGGQCSP